MQAPKYAETHFMVYCTLPVRVTTCLACLAAGGRPVSLLVASSPLVLEKPYKCFFSRTVVLQFLVLTALCKRSCEYSIGTADSHMLHIMHCWNHMRTCHSNVVFVWLIECACDNRDRNMRYTCSMKQDISAAKGPSSVADTKHQLFGIYL